MRICCPSSLLLAALIFTCGLTLVLSDDTVEGTAPRRDEPLHKTAEPNTGLNTHLFIFPLDELFSLHCLMVILEVLS